MDCDWAIVDSDGITIDSADTKEEAETIVEEKEYKDVRIKSRGKMSNLRWRDWWTRF